jgi:hypothetical protein
MRRALEVLLLGLAFGSALGQAGCQSDGRPWVPSEEHKVKVVSEAAFVRTGRGDFVDGYLAEYHTDFKKQRIFMVLELPHYLKGERLIVTGRFSGDFVRMASGDPALDKVPVFEVEKARPDVPEAPDIPLLK